MKVVPAATSGSDFEAADTFKSVLESALNASDRVESPCVLMGGVGSALLGRPRWTHDIDFFTTPLTAEKFLVELEAEGFRTEKRDPRWLFKAWKDDVLVDVIFRSAGDIYLDDEMVARATLHKIGARIAHVLAPEDLIVIKAVVADEHLAHHWYDALLLLASGELDWSYLVRRARQHAIRRVLSLLLYADSMDIWVPPDRVVELFQALHPPLESR